MTPKFLIRIPRWYLDRIEENFDTLSITRGRDHTYVGMDFHHPGDGSVHISAKDYIKEAIQDFGEDVSKGAMTPAGNDLFTVKDEGNLLSKTNGEVFHSIVGELLFITKRSRPDITLTIAFLCTRVFKSTHGDWEKVKRLLKYLDTGLLIWLGLSSWMGPASFLSGPTRRLHAMTIY